MGDAVVEKIGIMGLQMFYDAAPTYIVNTRKQGGGYSTVKYSHFAGENSPFLHDQPGRAFRMDGLAPEALYVTLVDIHRQHSVLITVPASKYTWVYLTVERSPPCGRKNARRM